jgi:hypothetical protein
MLIIVMTTFAIFAGVLSKGASPVFVEETFAPIDQFEAVGRQLLGGMYTPFFSPFTFPSFYHISPSFIFGLPSLFTTPVSTQFLVLVFYVVTPQTVKLEAMKALYFYSCPNF